MMSRINAPLAPVVEQLSGNDGAVQEFVGGTEYGHEIFKTLDNL